MLTSDRTIGTSQRRGPRTGRPASTRRRSTAAVVAAGTVASVLGVVAAPATVGAERVASPAIAAEAARAVEIYQRWHDEQHPADYIRFVQIRSSVAALTSAELGVDTDVLDETWSDAPEQKQVAVLAAMSQLGVPYERYESEPGVGFDCSGLTQWAYGQAGVGIDRNSRFQYRAAEPLEAAEAGPGDLVYYPGHIAMYLGEGLIVHSPTTGRTVEAGRMFDRRVSFADPLADD